MNSNRVGNSNGFSRRRFFSVIGLVAAWAAMALSATGSRATAATFTWAGGTSTAWATAGNWVNVQVPTAGSIVLFNSGSYTNQPTTATTSQSVGAVWDIGSGTVAIGGTTGKLTLTGTTIGLNAGTGIELDNGAGSLTIAAPVALGNAQQWINNNPSQKLTISGVVSGVAANTLTAAGAGVITLGTGGALANTFSGSVVVSGGTLQANGTANSTNPIATPLGNPQLANRTITVNNGGVLQFTQGNVLGGGSSLIQTPLIINAGGLVNSTVVNSNNVLGPVTLSGGTLTGGSGPTTDNNLTYQLTAGSVTVNTAPSLMAATSMTGTGYGYNMGQNPTAAGATVFSTTFNVALTGTAGTVSANPDLTVAATLADLPGKPQFTGGIYTASLVKIGAGTMLLLGSDTYTGTTTVNGGALVLGNSAALLLSTFDASGAGTLSFGTLSNAIFGGLQGATGTVALTSNAGTTPVALTVGNNNNSTTFSGTLSDAGLGSSLTKIGTGTLTLAGNNTYVGATALNNGAMVVSGSLSSTTVTVAGATILTASSNAYIGGSMAVNGGMFSTGGNSTVSGNVAINSGGTMTAGISTIGGSLAVDGGGALTLALANSAAQLTVGNGLTLGSTAGGYGAGNYATLSYTVSSNGTQPINLGANALTVNSGGVFVNVSFANTPPAGAVYPLINFGSQNVTGSFSLDPFTPNVTSLPIGRDTYNLVDAANALQLQIVGPPVPGVAYFYGAVSNVWSDLSNSTSCNWSSNLAGTQDALNIPGSITDVILSANNLSGSAVANTLGANFAINSLNANASAASTTIGNFGDTTTLTINALADSNTNSSGYMGNPAGNGISIATAAGPVIINVPVLLGNSQTWTNSSTGGLTLTNSVSGTAASGNTQSLTLTNAAGGGTTFSGAIGDGTAGGNLAVVVNNTGAGTTVLAGASTYTGGTTINSGTLQVANANGLPSGAGTGNVVLSSSGGGILDLDGTPVVYINGLAGGGGTSLGQVINSGTGTIATLNLGNGNGSATYSGVIADNNGSGGQVSLVKSGSGTQVLSGSNTYSDGTAINGGVLGAANAAALSSGTIQFGGGKLQFSPSNTNDYSALIVNSSGPISIDTNGQTVTFASNLDISNVGGLTKAGSGTLVLSGNNAYSGATLINSGTLSVTGTGSLSSSTGTVEVGTTPDSSAALVFGPASVTNLTAINSPFLVAYGSTVTVPAGASFTTAGFVRLGSLAVGSSGTFNQSGGTVSINGSDSANGSRSLTIGEFSGETSTYNLSGGSLSVPNGTVFLAWAGNGILNINGGTASFGKVSCGVTTNTCVSTLELTGGGALYLGSGGLVQGTNDTPHINLDNGTVGATAAWSSSVPLTLTYTGGTNFDTTGGNITLSGAISGSGGMTIVGSNVLALGSGGALASSFTGNVLVSGGTLEANGTANSTNPTGSALGNPQNASRTITINNATELLFNQSNVLGGGGSIIKTPLLINSALVNSVNNINNVLGPITLSGGTLAGGNGGASGKFLTYQLTAGSVTVNTAPSLIAVSGGTSSGLNMGQNSTAGTVTTTTFNVGLTGTAGTVSANPDLTVAANLGDIPGAVQFSGSPGFSASLVKTGAGTMLLASSDSYSGTTLVNGGALVLGDPNSLMQSTFDTNGSGTLSFGTLSNATFGGLQGAPSLALTASGGLTPVALTVGNNNNSTTFSGTLSDAALGGSLTKIGTGTLTLTGTNNYLGGTTVTNGTLIVTNVNWIDPAGIGTNLSVGNGLGAFGAIVPAPVGSAAAQAVPEPSTLALLLLAATGVPLYCRKRRKRTPSEQRNLK